VAQAVGEGIARARRGEGPSFVEAVTYRRTGHFKAEPALYRPPEELRRWEARDPIARLEALLLAQGILAAEAAARVWEEVRAEVSAAARAAEAEPPLTAADLGLDEMSEHG
jgi:pyruvate dehydrogenase E1 component alpha subunit